MKYFNSNPSGKRGYTLVEMMVALGVLGLLGGVFFQVLQSGITLAAKNTAVNAAHEEGRQGILRLTRDIHAAVSVPQLRDSPHDANYTYAGSFSAVSSAPVSGVAPMAAGVSFQNVCAGSPNYVWKDQNNPATIMVNDRPLPPTPGQRLIIPAWGIEDDIINAPPSTTPQHTLVHLLNGEETQVNPPALGGTAYAIVYYTERMLYLVQDGNYVADAQGPYVLSSGAYVPYTSGAMQRYRYENGQLHLYKQRWSSSGGGSSGYLYWQDSAVVAKYISSPKPFYVPLNSSGSPDTKYVGVNLTARDPKSSNRGFLATATLLNTQIDYRSRITLYQ
ncbi:MAG: hypothetical protein QOH39_1213 [Verrucomicrobiota bacterium]|jgi:prepilin-type N-terminal cleavage/methylation domain-containing protein